ncbi:hypothetical protein CR513_30602, partial [Mucuna pruriens]
MDKDLLKMFRKVKINIPLLDVPKNAKFLKELCIHKRKKIRGEAKMGGIMLALAQNEGATAECTFVDAMLDLGASINVMPTSVYKSLNFGDLEPTRMTIQLANLMVTNSIDMISTQTRDITKILCKIYHRTTKDINHLFPSIKHLHSDNSSPCSSLYNKIPQRI